MIILLAMSPVLELRGSIPLGLIWYHMDWPVVLLLSVLANTLVVPFIWWLLEPVERVLRRSRKLDHLIDLLYNKVRHRSRKRIETYEEIALFFLVAVPLPGTGAWTGSLIVHLFDLPRRKSYLVIFAGVLAAGIITTVVTLAGVGLWDWLVARGGP